MKKKFKILLLGLSLVMSLAGYFNPTFVHAADPKDIERCNTLAKYFNFGNDNLVNGLPRYCSLTDVTTFVLTTLLYLSGTVTILFLIVGGFFYVTAAGNEEQLEKGKKIIINSVIGLIVIVMATAIVKIVSNTLQGGANRTPTTTNTSRN